MCEPQQFSNGSRHKRFLPNIASVITLHFCNTPSGIYKFLGGWNIICLVTKMCPEESKGRECVRKAANIT